MNNPYLASALSALAEYPLRVQNLFEDQELSEQSIYFVKICKDGVWRYVILDDLLPCLEESAKIAFLKTRGLSNVKKIKNFLRFF